MTNDDIFELIRAAGAAALTADIENSHSGNISVKFIGGGGAERVAITAAGSQKGELTPDKICYPSLECTNHGYFKASSETDIHARVLSLPGVRACMHGHTRMAVIVTMDDEPPEKPAKAAAREPLRPADPLGVRHLGEVPVDWFRVASGSPEMAETIPARLAERPAMLVQGHGAMARGETLEEALFNLCLCEYSGKTLWLAERIGADTGPARARLAEMAPSLEKALPAYSAIDNSARHFDDEPDTVETFLRAGYRLFESSLSPFHAGSMSVRAATTMLYLPRAGMPRDLPGPMLELPLSASGGAVADSELHRHIYSNTPVKALMHCYLAEADALIASGGEYILSEPSRVLPIDAEGGFLYPAIPVLPPDPDPDLLAKTLLDYHVCVVALGGVWATGEQSISEALHHVSSAKDILQYRIMAIMRGLNLKALEPERTRGW